MQHPAAAQVRSPAARQPQGQRRAERRNAARAATFSSFSTHTATTHCAGRQAASASAVLVARATVNVAGSAAVAQWVRGCSADGSARNSAAAVAVTSGSTRENWPSGKSGEAGTSPPSLTPRNSAACSGAPHSSSEPAYCICEPRVSTLSSWHRGAVF